MGILLGIASMRNGIALIDQLEDGFYYDRFPSLWKLIHKSAIDNNVQVFVTTHSKECLDALPGAIEGYESDFALIKAEGQSGRLDYTQINGKSIKGAIRQGFDPR